MRLFQNGSPSLIEEGPPPVTISVSILGIISILISIIILGAVLTAVSTLAVITLAIITLVICGIRFLAKLYFHGNLFIITVICSLYNDLHGISGFAASQTILQSIHGCCLISVKFDNDIACLDTGFSGRRILCDFTHINSFRHIVILAVSGGVSLVDTHAHVSLAGDITLGDKIVCDAGRVIDRDREAQTLHPGGTVLGSHYADDFAAGVVHGAAGVAGVDRRVDLEHVDRAAALFGGDETVKGAYEVNSSSPRGLPTAHTSSPTARLSLLPSVAGVRPVASIFRTAMSLLASMPTIVAS